MHDRSNYLCAFASKPDFCRYVTKNNEGDSANSLLMLIIYTINLNKSRSSITWKKNYNIPQACDEHWIQSIGMKSLFKKIIKSIKGHLKRAPQAANIEPVIILILLCNVQ